MDTIVEFLKMKRRLKKWTRNVIFGKPRNLSRDYLASAGPFELVVHVGAHIGQEVELYRSLGAQRIVWVEGDPETYRRLLENLTEADRRGGSHIRHETFCALVSDTNDWTRSFYRFNNEGASSSVYAPTQRHLREWPGLKPIGHTVELRTRTLESILEEAQVDPLSTSNSLLIIDVQGHEAAVLAGIGRYARTFALCECEVSKEPIYEGGALYPEIKVLFGAMGYQLASHHEEELPWHGDVIFKRNNDGADELTENIERIPMLRSDAEFEA
jgi:FkbM family methyltransferase